MTTPSQGNALPRGAWWAADNGKFSGKGWPGDGPWFAWLAATAARYGTRRCLFAPDVPFDAAATLAESTPWLARIRDLGLPAAFAAQDGCHLLGLPSWDEFDTLFLAGSDTFKLGPDAHRLTLEAKERGKRVHMGRVNSLRRLRIAEWFGCDSADGTYLKHGPAKNLGRLLGWLDEIDHVPSLVAAKR